MTSECAPDAGRAPWPVAGRSGFRLVLGQPDEQRGGRSPMSHEDRLRESIANDLDGTFEELVRVYQDRLFSYALRLTGRREDAEEVAQDAFVRAYRALGTYPAERIRALALRPWLYRITLNVARNRFRGKKLRTVSLDQPISADSDQRWEPADHADGPDRALRALPRAPRHRGPRWPRCRSVTGRRCSFVTSRACGSKRSPRSSGSPWERRSRTSIVESTPCARPFRARAGRG